MCQEIIKKAGNWIKFPTSDEELEAAKTLWLTKNTFPNAIGALDCTHVMIKKPTGISVYKMMKMEENN